MRVLSQLCSQGTSTPTIQRWPVTGRVASSALGRSHVTCKLLLCASSLPLQALVQSPAPSAGCPREICAVPHVASVPRAVAALARPVQDLDHPSVSSKHTEVCTKARHQEGTWKGIGGAGCVGTKASIGTNFPS